MQLFGLAVGAQKTLLPKMLSAQEQLRAQPLLPLLTNPDYLLQKHVTP